MKLLLNTKLSLKVALAFLRSHQRVILGMVWLATFISLAGLMITSRKTEGAVWVTPGIFWDVAIYDRAIEAVRVGLDPYAVGLARQHLAEATGQHAFTYVYPPITLVVLRAINLVPAWFAMALYWLIYIAGYAAVVWAISQFFRPQDRPVMQYAVPLIVFFPSLMTDKVILSGNVAYVFYGLLFAATVVGWRRGVWRWFYVAMLLTASFKLPLLTLLAIPALAGKRQWAKATAVGAAGVSIWALQSWLWPIQFREYLESVNLQFLYNHDFGESLAGNIGRALYSHGMPFTILPTLVFLAYGSILFATLYYFSRLYHAGRLSAETWFPVLLVGTVLLNPRIMQYDVHVISLAMALILWRSVASRSRVGLALAISVLILVIIDLLGVNFYYWDDIRNMCILMAVMGLGLRSLVVEASESEERVFVIPLTVQPNRAVGEIET